MKKYITVIFVLLISFSVYAQTNTIDTNSNFRNNVNLGVGSSFFGFITNTLVKGSLVNKAYATPVFHLAYEREVLDNTYMGINAGYQNFYFDLLPIDSDHSVLITNINRINLSLSADHFFLNQPRFNMFFGGQLGLTIWEGRLSFEELVSYVNELIPIQVVSDMITKKLIPSSDNFFTTNFSYQLHLGMEKYFTDNLGLRGTIAVGSPYWAMIGLNYRF